MLATNTKTELSILVNLVFPKIIASKCWWWMGATVRGRDDERLETMLAGQNILEIEHSVRARIHSWNGAEHAGGTETAHCMENDKTNTRCQDAKITRLQLMSEANIWMEAPRTETLIPLQQDQWKLKLLKKAANSDIVYWLEHNRLSQQCLLHGRVSNILMSMG